MNEFIIIGAGAAGFSALIRANELGIKPVLVNKGPLGGTCVNFGCVPTKKLLRTGEIYGYAGKYCNNVHPDILASVKEKDLVVEKLRKEKYEDVLDAYDHLYIDGYARFLSPSAIKVNGKIIEGKKFLIATGSSIRVPEIPGLVETGFWTNIEALSPEGRVESIAVIGGRAQALEFAQMYRMLGVNVTILQRSRLLIPDWEPEISMAIQERLERDGIDVFTGTAIKKIWKGKEGKVIETDSGELVVDEILLATGRSPNVDLNPENANIRLNEDGWIAVGEDLRTSNPNVFAAGDVVGEPMLETLAGREGKIATENAILNKSEKIDFSSIPQAIFTKPNLARVGMTLVNANKLGYADWRTVKIRNIAKAQIIGETEGLIKMIIDRNKKIMGVHIMAENGAEIINEAALAIKMNATIDQIIDTVHVFPTMAESLKIAALSFYRDIGKLSCCAD